MTSTRSSERVAADSSSSNHEEANVSPEAVAGSKRKAPSKSSPAPDSGEDGSNKVQKTIDETMLSKKSEHDNNDIEMKDEHDMKQEDSDDNAKGKGEVEDNKKEEATGDHEMDSKDTNGSSAPEGNSGGAIEESSKRENAKPSSIVEKGIIYFFTRPRVGMEEPESVSDLQRTFFVLRPLPDGAKITDGPIEDSKNNRLFALPKKVFPKSHNDRFMAFVEKASVSIQSLKDDFFKGNEYSTKTMGTRKNPPVSPVGEGVYAITHTDRSTRLVYMLTIPSEPNEVQKELGLGNQGAFIVSVKNPERGGPSSAQLPEQPKFPKEVIEEFQGLAWTAVKPKFLEYENVQILLIGDGGEKNLGQAVEQTAKDDKHNKDTPLEQLEQLEHEDELRVEHLHGDDSIFDDLKISKSEYPDILTTW